jgi:hypothetical protein
MSLPGSLPEVQARVLEAARRFLNGEPSAISHQPSVADG